MCWANLQHDCEATHMGASPNKNAILSSPSLFGRQAGNNFPDRPKVLADNWLGGAEIYLSSGLRRQSQAWSSQQWWTMIQGRALTRLFAPLLVPSSDEKYVTCPHMQPELFVLTTQSYIKCYN